MLTHESLPPAEWLHTKQCFAAALIAAVENLRDSEVTHHDFTLSVQDGIPREWAFGYLADGTMTCTCPRTCDRGKPGWECRPQSLCDRCIEERISSALEIGDLKEADEWGYKLWSKMSDDEIREQRALSVAANATHEVATCDRILGDRGYDS